MTTLTVGAGQQFATLAAAIAASSDGDTLAVQAGIYRNDFAAIRTDITIEGVGGMVELVATVAPPNGKAILTTNGDVTIRNLSFSGAEVPDGNGAGIRFEGGNLVVENSRFHDNQDGLLSGAVPGGTITIRDSEFAGNGTGDGRTHNLYVGDIARLTVEDSHFHNVILGHEIKSRAQETIITGSTIEEGEGGTGSYSIDLPNGGKATITGNYIEQGADSQNPAMIHFGGEGTAYAGSSLTVSGNTVVNDLDSSSASLVLNQTGVTVSVADNAVFGLTEAQIARGLATIGDVVQLLARPVAQVVDDLLGSGSGQDSGSAGGQADSDAGPATGDDAAAPSDMAAVPDDTAAAPGDTAAAPDDTDAVPGDTAAAPGVDIEPGDMQDAGNDGQIDLGHVQDAGPYDYITGGLSGWSPQWPEANAFHQQQWDHQDGIWG